MARILIRPPEKSDQDAFLAAVQRSRRLHRSWVRAPQTPERFQEYLSRLDPQSNWSFLVCLREGGELGSIALVRACGFEREGYSRAYLKIAGRWRDHERWAIVSRPG